MDSRSHSRRRPDVEPDDIVTGGHQGRRHLDTDVAEMASQQRSSINHSSRPVRHVDASKSRGSRPADSDILWRLSAASRSRAYSCAVLFTPTPLAGAWLIELERHTDERESFARTFCAREFAEHGLPRDFPRRACRRTRGRARSAVCVADPDEEAKVVRCVRRAMFDVIVDVRADSPTRWQWFGVDLSADDGRALFVPAGFAHGFLTTEPKTDVLYQISEFFTPDAGRGIRWDDPAIGFAGPAALR